MVYLVRCTCHCAPGPWCELLFPTYKGGCFMIAEGGLRGILCVPPSVSLFPIKYEDWGEEEMASGNAEHALLAGAPATTLVAP